MYTQAMIGLAVATAAAVAGAGWAAFVAGLGRRAGSMAALLLAAVGTIGYRVAVRPWHLRWGATDEETARDMPGDELLPEARPATRAITIVATPEQIWPWLVHSDTVERVGTATTGSTTTSSPAPIGSCPSSSTWRPGTRS